MKYLLPLVCLFFILSSCHDESKIRDALMTSKAKSTASAGVMYDDELEMIPPRTAQPDDIPSPSDKPIDKGSKIIRNGSMTIAVDSLGLAKNYIDSLLAKSNGYYENELYSGTYGEHRFVLKIRMPASNFDDFVKSLEAGDGKVKNKNISANDVTGEYIDLGIRLENNKAYLERYRGLLKKAQTIKDILEIQEKIRRIETEIDAQIGRRKHIQDQVDFSSLNLSIYQEIVNTYKPIKPTFISRIWNSAKFGFSVLQEIFLGLIAAWPLIILGVSLYFGIRRYRRKRKNEVDPNS